MARPNDALNIAGFALAACLGLLAFMQWRSARTFTADATPTEGRIVDVRSAKKAIFDADSDIFPTVEYRVPGEEAMRRAELVTTLARIGVSAEEAMGREIPLLVDPGAPGKPRYGRGKAGEGALVLLALAFGALFAPGILRRSLLRGGGGG